MNATWGKAVAGAGAGLAEANMEAMKAEILAMHDQRLNEYENQRLSGIIQPFEASQNQERIQAQKENVQADIASREKIAGQTADIDKQRLAQQAPLVKAQVDAAHQAYQEGKIKLTQLQTVQDLYNEYRNETDPAKQTKLGMMIDLYMNRDTFAAARTTDDNGMPKDVIFSKRTGATFGAGGTNQGGASGGTGGGQTPSISDPFKGGGAMTPETQASYSRLMGLGGAPANGQDETAFTNGFNGVRSGTQPTGAATRPAPPLVWGDDTAFQAGFHEARGTPNFRSTTPAPATAAAAAPAAGSLQPIETSSRGPFEKVASAVSDAAGQYRAQHYRPGVITGPNGAKTTIQPGTTTTISGKHITFDAYLQDTPQGALWKVHDSQGAIYQYTAPLQ